MATRKKKSRYTKQELLQMRDDFERLIRGTPGIRYRDLAEEMTKLGWVSSSGRPFTHGVVSGLLRRMGLETRGQRGKAAAIREIIESTSEVTPSAPNWMRAVLTAENLTAEQKVRILAAALQ